MIHVDICAEEMTANTYSLVEDCLLIIEGLNEKSDGYSLSLQNEWWNYLNIKRNQHN